MFTLNLKYETILPYLYVVVVVVVVMVVVVRPPVRPPHGWLTRLGANWAALGHCVVSACEKKWG